MTIDGSNRSPLPHAIPIPSSFSSSSLSIPPLTPTQPRAHSRSSQDVVLNIPSTSLPPIVTSSLPVYTHNPFSPTTAATESPSIKSPGTAGTQRTLFDQDDDGAYVVSTDQFKIDGLGKQLPGLLLSNSNNLESTKEESDQQSSQPPKIGDDQHTTITSSSTVITALTPLRLGLRKPRHPPRIQNSIYVRFFRLDTEGTRTEALVLSSWLSTGALFCVRFLLFLYTAIVLITDMFLNDRPQFAFCYLTQLSYFGMISYLGVTSWHTLSEWRRERGLRIRKEKSVSKDAGSFLDLVEIPSTTVERQHWLLTDMNFFLYHTICTFHVIVPILFWGYLGLEGDAKETAVGMKPDGLWRNYSFHGGDLIVLMIEVIINTMSFVPSHVAIVFVICLLYLAEAHVVYAVDGFWIYPFLDTTGGPIWVALYLGVGFVILCAFIAMYYLHRIRNWIRVRGKVPVVESTATTVEVLKGKQGVDTRQEEHIESTFSSTIDQVVSPAPSYTTETIESVQYQKKVDQRSRRSNSHGSHDSSTSTLVNSPFSLTTDSAKHHHRHSEDDTPSSSFSTVYSESRLQKVMEEDDSIDH